MGRPAPTPSRCPQSSSEQPPQAMHSQRLADGTPLPGANRGSSRCRGLTRSGWTRSACSSDCRRSKCRTLPCSSSTIRTCETSRGVGQVGEQARARQREGCAGGAAARMRTAPSASHVPGRTMLHPSNTEASWVQPLVRAYHRYWFTMTKMAMHRPACGERAAGQGGGGGTLRWRLQHPRDRRCTRGFCSVHFNSISPFVEQCFYLECCKVPRATAMAPWIEQHNE